MLIIKIQWFSRIVVVPDTKQYQTVSTKQYQTASNSTVSLIVWYDEFSSYQSRKDEKYQGRKDEKINKFMVILCYYKREFFTLFNCKKAKKI